MKRILIHIPKTGGNTIQREPQLSNILVKFGPNELINSNYKTKMMATMNRYGLNYQFAHCRWRDLNVNFRNKHQAVAMVRNPWSKLVSQFLFAQKIDREHSAKNVTSVSQDVTFEEFLELRHKWGNTPYFWHRTTVGFYPQIDHVTDENGNLKCDILRFEHHEEDTSKYFNLESSIPHRNVSNGTVQNGIVTGQKDYKDFYTDATKKIVSEWYVRDIEFFGFTFDGTATKNIWNKK